MGLGLYLRANLPRKGWLERPSPADRILSEIASSGANFARASGDPIARWYWNSRSDSGLFLNFCPFDENVEFSLESDHVVCSAKTSGAGPGYHRYLVDFLDRLHEVVGLTWTEGEKGGDETEFFRQRDAGALEQAMCRQVRTLAKVLLDHAAQGNTGFRLNFPLDFAPKRDAFALSALGEWSQAWFEELADADDTRALQMASAFYPWWDSGLTAGNLRKLGMAACWMDVPWVSPANDRERVACEAALSCFERARQLDPGVDVPEWEIAELRRLLHPANEDMPPSENGIGFRRTAMNLPLTGRWTVELPGYFHSEYDPDSAAQVYFFGDRTFRASTWSFDAKSTPEEVLERVAPAKDARPLALRADHLIGHYTKSWNAEDEVFVLSADVAKVDGLCAATITYANEEEEAWALRAASSIFGPKPR